MRFTITLFALLLFCFPGMSQNYFQQAIDDTSWIDETVTLNKIVPATNGNFVATGNIILFDGFFYHYKSCVVMIDSSGSMLWNRVFEADSFFEFHTIYPIEGGYYIGGNYAFGALLVKTDSVGNILQAVEIKSNDGFPLYIHDILPYSNDLLLNCSEDFMGGGPFLIKMDTAGNLIPFIHYGFPDGFSVTDIKVDGNYVYLAGWKSNQAASERRAIVVQCNETGSLPWAKRVKLDGIPYDSFRAIHVNDDHSITAVFDARYYVWGYDGRVVLNRIDSNGNFLFHKCYMKTAFDRIDISDMGVSPQNKITLSGVDGDMLLQFDENFNFLSGKALGDPYSDLAFSMTQTDAGNLLVAGIRNGTGNGMVRKVSLDLEGCNPQDYLLEEDTMDLTIEDINGISQEDNSFTSWPVSFTATSTLISNLGCDTLTSVNDITNPETLQLYPNPFSHTFTLVPDGNAEINIYDVAGRKLESHQEQNSFFTSGGNLVPGIYFVEVKNTSGTHQLLKAVKVQ